jgi:hypothetical protein
MRAPTPTLLHYLNRSVRDQKGLGRTLRGAWHVGAGTTVVVAGGAIGGPFPAAWATCCCGPSCSQAMHRKRRHLSPLRDLPTRPSCSMSRPGPYECLRADSLASALSSGQARPSPRRLGLEGSLRFVTLATAVSTSPPAEPPSPHPLPGSSDSASKRLFDWPFQVSAHTKHHILFVWLIDWFVLIVGNKPCHRCVSDCVLRSVCVHA